MSKIAAPEQADRIRVLNDNFRSTFVGGQVVMTAGVNALPLDTKARVLLAVQSFSNFTKDNDPHGEHDFGSFEIEGETYFLKIDYYDPRHGRRLRRSRRPGEDDARAHHHARRRVLTPPTNRKELTMANQQPDLPGVHRRQTRRPRRLLAQHRRGVHAPGRRGLQRHPASAPHQRQNRPASRRKRTQRTTPRRPARNPRRKRSAQGTRPRNK